MWCSKFEFESKIGKFVASGKGPGLLLVAFGGTILFTALFTGTASMEQKQAVQPEKQIEAKTDLLDKKSRNTLNELNNLGKQ